MVQSEGGSADEEIRAVPVGAERHPEHARGVATAMENAAKEDRGQFDKELKDLERVHAKYAKRAEKAAGSAGLDQASIKAELDGLRELPQEQIEQGLAELAKKYRPMRGQVFRAAGINRDSLADEALSVVKLPTHAKAIGRQKDAGQGDRDDLGWTMEVEES